ncbi:type VI secretion system tip protein TssI/VgrG, partial [Propioniciclava sp.]|uniref:type VI secretion system Vgr family protein n=1 Tax=Propioniciclava sp. TaxID=2038686 RepID=UPI002625FF6B
ALALLAHRRNSRVWQDKSVVEIVTDLLAEHQAANPAFRRSFALRDATRQRYPQRSYCLQYRETDLDFLTRLLAEEGIAWRYVHGPDPDLSHRDADAPIDDGVPRHTLVLFDDNFSLPVLTPEREIGRTGRFVPAGIRFHRAAGVEADDALDVWHGTRQVQSGKSTLLAYDYKNVAAHLGGDTAATAQGQAGDPLSAALEDYDPQTLYYGSDPGEMARYAALRQQAKDRAAKTFTGEGSVRRLAAGGWFPLADHPNHDPDPEKDRQFLVTRLTLAARNNLLPEADDPFPLPDGSLLAAGGDKGDETQGPTPYRARLEAIRRHIRVVPDYTRTAHQKPTAPGGTTATVVGPDGEEIHTDAHGRIKLQFHWQRKEDHPDGGADGDERSSTWVRVAYPSAGAAWGSQYIPRIGQEVLVSFLENDIDRPVVTGVLYNGTHRPPEFSAAGRLPANK